LIIAFVFIWWLGYYFIDIIFYERAAAYYVNANQLADFLGGFFSLSGLIALITTTFFTAPLLDRYGLWVGLLIVPCIIVAAIAGLILAGMFGAAAGVLFGFAVLAKLVNLALGFALDLPAHAILYNPFSASQVGRLSTIAEGIVQPLAIGVAGVALLAVNAGWALGELAQPVMFLAIGAIWIAVVILLIRAYPRVLALAFARRQLSTSAQALPDHASLAVLQRELHNPYAGAALYALQLLEQLAPQALESTVPELLNHPASEVRAAAIAAIERLELHEAGAALRAHLLEEQEPTVRGATLQALAAVDPSTLELVVATLHEADPEVLRGALVGLIRHGGIDGVMAAGQRFNALTNSETATERALAARVLGDVGVKHFYQPLWALLADTEPSVQRAALAAAGKIAHPRLWPAVVAASVAPETSRAASSALIVGGEQTLDAIAAGLARPDLRSHGRIALARACGRIGGQRAVALLAEMVNYPDPGVRTQVLAALCACPIPVNPEPLQAQLHTELAEAAWLTAMLVEASSNPRLTLLANALATALQRSRDRIFVLLALLFDRPAILQARDAIASTVAAQRAHAIEVIDVQIPPPLRRFVLPLIEDRPPADRLTQLRPIYGLPDSGALDLPSMLTGSRSTTIAPWVRACAIDAVVQLQTANAYPALTALVNTPNHLIAETATWALAQINQIHLQADTVSTRPNKGAETMLSTIEKVIILKTVSVFSQTPDDVLAVVAGLLEEVDVRADQQVFAKGDYGDCLYIIIRGRVRVHDGDRLLDELGERDVFGEMALLDPQPRLASVTASEAVHLFRLAEAPFYELISEQPEVAIGIIRVLTRRLRERVQDLATLNQRVNDLEATQIAPETPVLYRQHTAGEVAASV
jgi:CRP-like cAMP-binding protein/HEAT repeat protein